MKKVLLLGLFLSVTTAAPAWAETQFGFVNVAKVLAESPQRAAADARLDKEFAPRRDALQQQRDELQQLEAELAKEGDTLSAEQRTKKEADITKKRRDFERERDRFRDDVNVRQRDEMDKIERVVLETIETVGKAQRLDMVLDIRALLYASDKLDVTEKVLAKLREVSTPAASTPETGSSAPAAGDKSAPKNKVKK